MKLFAELTQDDEFKFLTAEGFEGSLNDMIVKYLADQGINLASVSDMLAWWDGVTSSNDIQMTIETTGADELFTLEAHDIGTYSATIDWGDETTSTITSYNDADLAHTYAVAGDYTIAISGMFPSLKASPAVNPANLKQVLSLGNTGLTTLASAFNNRTGLTSIERDGADLSDVTSFSSFCIDSSSSKTVDLSGGPLTSCTTMFKMFNNDRVTTLDMTGCVADSLTSIRQAWRRNSSMTLAYLGDLFGPEHSGNVDAREAFLGCSSLQYSGAEQWNVENFTNLTDFMLGCNVPTTHYDDILVAWAGQSVNAGLSVNFGSSQYTLGGAAEAARDTLVNTHGWTITDGGGV